MKTQLAIEISENAVRFAQLEEGNVVSVDFFRFKEKVDYRYKEQLEEFVKEKGYRENEYDDYSLSWCSKLSTLLPSNVYNEVSNEALVKLCFHQIVPTDTLDHNRIPELSIVNVFSIPLWVKSFFVIRFPKIIIQHEGSHLLHGLLSKNAFSLQIAVVLHESVFNVTITQENGLKFYAYFDYDSADDVVYHLMFTLQQKELLNQKGIIHLCASVGTSDESVIAIKLLLDKLTDLKSFQTKINSHLLLNYQSLCV
jgi:hypothetical protein